MRQECAAGYEGNSKSTVFKNVLNHGITNQHQLRLTSYHTHIQNTDVISIILEIRDT